MRHLVPTLLLLGVLPTGCGTDVEVLDDNIEKQLTWQQVPGEIQDCHVFKLDNARHVEIDRLQVKFAEGSHHVHIYRSTEPEEDKVYDCFKGIDWTRWTLLIGAQTKSMDWQLPEGVTIPLEPHQQLLAQVHWLNTGDAPVSEKIDLAFHTTEDSREHLGTLFAVNKRIDINPNTSSRVEHFCQMPQGAKLHAMMGHFHARGVGYQVTERMPDQTTGSVIYQAPNEAAFEFQTFAPAHPVPTGAGFQYDCDFYNDTAARLTWGSDTHTQEHCNMTAYYSPAETVSQMCVLEPSKLSKLTPVKSTATVGEDVTFDIELASPEATDVAVALQSSDPLAIEVPASVTIPAGARKISFNARTRRPAPVEVSATLNGARIITPVRVTGLVLSEVFYNPATSSTNGLQWIEIANTSNVSIDLSGYSIGAGTTDFMRTRLSLPMTIGPRSCIVVGGPQSSPANYDPIFTVAQDLSPDLGMGGERAEGIGLFATGPAGIGPTSRPIDVVVYNGQNMTLRGPDGEIATVWQGTQPGRSLKRQSDTFWSQSTFFSPPSPGNCEIINAR
jgi:hypothetical protein